MVAAAAAARLPPVQFVPIADARYYMCSECRTHIALFDDLQFGEAVSHRHTPQPQSNLLDVLKIVFSSVVNVRIQLSSNNLLVLCATCNGQLGRVYTVPQGFSGYQRVFAPRFEIPARKLRFWDGNENVNAYVPE